GERKADLRRPHRRNGDNAFRRVGQASGWRSFVNRDIHTQRSEAGGLAAGTRARLTEAEMMVRQRAWRRRLSRCRRIRTTSANRTTSPTAVVSSLPRGPARAPEAGPSAAAVRAVTHPPPV